MKISNNQFNKLLKKEGAKELIWKHIQNKLTLTGSQLKILIEEKKKENANNQ